MPSTNCRDTDETCDWFYRDSDPGRVLAAAIQHGEESHPSYMHLEQGVANAVETVRRDMRP